VTLVDVSEPQAPAILANLDFPAPDPLPIELSDRAYVYTWWLTSYGGPVAGGRGEPALVLGDGRLGWVRVTTISCNDALACASLGIEPEYVAEDGTWAYGWRSLNTLFVLDLAARAFLPGVALGDGAVESALARHGLAAVSISQPLRVEPDGRTWVRSMLERIDVPAGGAPARRTPVNVPGVAAWVDAGGAHALLVDRQYVDRLGWLGTGVELSLVAVDVGDDTASVTSRLRLGDELVSLATSGERAYAVQTELYLGPDWTEWEPPETRLLAIDVRDRHDLSIASEQLLGDGYWWIAARTPTTLVLGGGYESGLALFDVGATPDHPVLIDYVRTLGWITSITEDGGTLYVVGGPYGIQAVPVAPAIP
jgi:hypothetical protein